jgi:hypothetical protein
VARHRVLRWNTRVGPAQGPAHAYGTGPPRCAGARYSRPPTEGGSRRQPRRPCPISRAPVRRTLSYPRVGRTYRPTASRLVATPSRGNRRTCRQLTRSPVRWYVPRTVPDGPRQGSRLPEEGGVSQRGTRGMAPVRRAPMFRCSLRGTSASARQVLHERGSENGSRNRPPNPRPPTRVPPEGKTIGRHLRAEVVSAPLVPVAPANGYVPRRRSTGSWSGPYASSTQRFARWGMFSVPPAYPHV